MKESINVDCHKCSRDLFEIQDEKFLEKYVKLTVLQLFKNCYPFSRALRNVQVNVSAHEQSSPRTILRERSAANVSGKRWDLAQKTI